MAFKTIQYQRQVEYSVDAEEAARLRREGNTLRQIKELLDSGASLATISRAIRRAEPVMTNAIAGEQRTYATAPQRGVS